MSVRIIPKTSKTLNKIKEIIKQVEQEAVNEERKLPKRKPGPFTYDDLYNDYDELVDGVFISNQKIERGKYAVFTREQYRRIRDNFVVESSNNDSKYPETLSSIHVKAAICGKFSFKTDNVKLFNFDSEKKIAGHILVYVSKGEYNLKMKKQLIRIMYKCGYFLAYAQCDNDDTDSMDATPWWFQFEPYKQPDDKLFVPDEIYHITTEETKDIIMMFGLKATTKSKFFKYPPRVYFFVKSDVLLMRRYATVCGKFKDDELIYSLSVSTKNLDVQFYADYNMPKDSAIFTYEDIQREFIKDDVKSFKLN